MIGKLRNSRAT